MLKLINKNFKIYLRKLDFSMYYIAQKFYLIQYF